MKKICAVLFFVTGTLSLSCMNFSSLDVSLGIGRVFYGEPAKYTDPNIFQLGISAPLQIGSWITRIGFTGWNYPNIMYEERAVSSQYYVNDSYFVYYNELFLTEGIEIKISKNALLLELGVSGLLPFSDSSAGSDIINWYYEDLTRIINIKSLVHYKFPVSDLINMTGGINVTYPISAFSESDIYDRLVVSLFVSSQMKIFR